MGGWNQGRVSTYLYDHNGNPFGLRHTRNALDVYIQDQTTRIVDLYLHKHVGDDLVITSNTNVDQYVLGVESQGHVAVGHLLCLKEGIHYYQGGVTSFTNQLIYLDTPLDYGFTTSAYCSPTTKEMNVAGSVNSLHTFHVRPTVGVKWDIVRIMFAIEGDSAMDSSLFGNLPALTNGIVLRKKDGDYYNIFNCKTNGDFANRAYDISYDDRAGGSGLYAFRCRRTFGGQGKNGAVIRLDGDDSEDIQVLIRDDLSALTRFNIVVQGHVVE